jgi:methionyl-tRNA formyltransferase
MSALKIVFMGTTSFGVPALEKLVSEKYDVATVVCQPDRPNKRGKKVEILPLKAKALELGIPVLQPEKVKDPEFVEQLKKIQADVYIVAAYGQILSKEVLELPQFGALNIHGSLLPEYRGAAPIQRAIIDGKMYTGVTIMQMAAGMDTGDMLAKSERSISETTTYGSLHDSLAEIGAELLIETLKGLVKGVMKPVPQEEQKATYAEKLLKETGHLNWGNQSEKLLRLINGTDPSPGAYSFYENEKIKFFSPEIIVWSGGEKPGTILQADDREGLIIKTGDGALKIGVIQVPGKKKMEAKVLLRGKKLVVGYILN